MVESREREELLVDIKQDVIQEKDDFLSRPVVAGWKLDWEKTIYILFILLAVVSRFHDLGSRVVSHDESLHTQYSYQFYNGDGYVHTPMMHGPSLFHATALSYWLFGDSDFSSRIPVAILGIMLVVAPYFLRDWIGRKGALLASFMLLISPYITYYSRYIRHDIYVIFFAVITFIAIHYYLREQKDKYLWWFTLGLVLMFTTMETAFIYVAIFGSFLVLRLLYLMWQSEWFHEAIPQLRRPLLLLALALLLMGGGFAGQQILPRLLDGNDAVEIRPSEELFAADPTAPVDVAATAPAEQGELVMRWLQIIGIFVLSGGLFMAAHQMRRHLLRYGEFDLIILFTTLVLPSASPILINIAGWNPLDYSVQRCGEVTMATLWPCVQLFFSSGAVRSGLFVAITLLASVGVGLWWNPRRWLIAAAIFHGIFLVLFTSIFTNPGGWASGTVGSLGYWLEQHEVERGEQPRYYYLFVTTIYEFLPIIFSILGARLWLQRHRLHKIAGYWLTAGLLALLSFSLVQWWYNEFIIGVGPGDAYSNTAGLFAAFLVALAAILFWFLARQRQIMAEYGLRRSWQGLFDGYALVGFVPFLAWWALLSWIGYSVAGERMPWLSSHFIFPMVLLAGWYGQQKLAGLKKEALWSRPALAYLGVALLAILAGFLAFSALWLGQIQLGNQMVENMAGIGRFLGSLVVLGLLIYLIMRLGEQLENGLRRALWLGGVFIILSLLTIRITYMSSFPNADYVTEHMVYAHGAPATKSVVMAQIEELSLRLHGDRSLVVAYDNDTSWPYTWYLRHFSNRIYYGENPGPNIADATVVIIGRRNWGKEEPFLRDDYEMTTHTFLWWPMEEYRRFSWNALLGDPKVEPDLRRGLGNPGVRQALWDIFFYRDYQRYSEVFGGNYAIGQWPLRNDLRLYIRKDVVAQLWDYGVGAAAVEPAVDPYAENILELDAAQIINVGRGMLSAPRNLALGPDGNLYVADSGNHRIQVFDEEGRFLRGWGEFGVEPGQFNEPWGLTVSDEYLFVADTWNHRIQKFSLDGEWIAAYGQSGSPAETDAGLGLFFGPRDVLLLPGGQLLVTDTGNHRLKLMTQDGDFVRQVGFQGPAPGQFNEPVSLAIGPDGLVYITDTWNRRVQVYGADLFPLEMWEVDAWRGESINNKPYLAVDGQSRVYITDPEGHRVLIFDWRGNYLASFGRFGAGSGEFGLLNGIVVAPDGTVYVADAGNDRILKFDPIFPRLPDEEAPPPDPEPIPGDEEETNLIEPTEEVDDD